MFQIERLQLIKQVLNEQKSVDVLWLSNYLKVSEVTVRRDLEKLETEGFLKRTYGGAVLNESFRSPEPKIEPKVIAETSAKNISERSRAFGKMCAALVEDHDIIFLGGGEANYALAENLTDKIGVVIFTNNLDVLRCVDRQSGNKVILVGGEADVDRGILCIRSANIPFPEIRVNKAFLYVQGVDLDYGISINYHEDAFIYQEVKKRAKKMVVIMEGSIFEKIGLIRVDDIDGINYVVTDDGIPDTYKRFFYKNGIQLHQKFDF